MPGPRFLLRSRRSAALVVLVGFAAAIGALLIAAPQAATPRSATGLSTTAESARVEQLQAELPGTEGSVALLVYSRADGSPLDDSGRQAVAKGTALARSKAVTDQGPPPQFSDDGKVALVVVTLPEQDDEATAATVDDLRSALGRDLPDGVVVNVTGPAAFGTDLTRVFDGADTRLLIVTAAVVALLLLLTYRSPGLVLIPLIVVGLTEQATISVADQVLARLGIPGGGQVSGIASVLVFGAATDYALLLIARYREELRLDQDVLVAMRAAVRRVAEPVLASGGTVIGALALLLLASTETLQGIAVACIIGVLFAMIATLLILPAALVLFGRRIFWPFVPKLGEAAREGKVWGRLGTAVARRPLAVLIAAGVLLGGMAIGIGGVRTGLAQNEQFRVEPEAVRGAKVLAAAFPAGTTEPLIVIGAASAADKIVAATKEVDGVAQVRPGRRTAELAEFQVVLSAEPGSEQSARVVEELRQRLHDLESAQALVGGGAAEDVDVKAADQRDRTLIMPLILALVGLVLLALLRSLLAPVLLVLTVVASFFASFGASWWLFEHVLDFPALDGTVILLSFLFLVALGVDYNIFLTTRAREEAGRDGTKDGMLAALRLTGGVITSAGLLLAAVFAVLGVLPLITLTQVGVIVCVGVLLDALVVRTVVVPALVFVLGDRFWWPGRPAQPARSAGLDGPAEKVTEG
ncbi:MMPL family transporter [Kribbella sp. CA-293567]|uniref:MMPL family transporter n=1 Tax=Kribbella sp. CA-293567 TaxID=3002436 RepID=UPI0022DE3B72|nr:MMPL family transporter [Kribbella sp. CA-293567]WBQ08250.1 MMPL family transporter [Kribbella sp. CA-293567]